MKCNVLVSFALLVAFPSVTTADVLHLKTPSTVKTDGGTSLRLPPGYFLEEMDYEKLDGTLKEMELQQIRLEAENQSLRDSADEVSFGWITLGAAVLAGVATGYLLAR